MKFLARLAWAALSFVLIGRADTAGKPPSAGPSATTAPATSVTGWSGWAFVPMARNGVVSFPRTKDFHDTQFEYRWKSEWIVNRYVCTIEIRDVDSNHTIREIDVAYSGGRGRLPFQSLTARDIPVAKLEHAYLKAPDCERVNLINWLK